MTSDTKQDSPCLPGGLIPLDQWQVPEAPVHRSVRGAFRDILHQLRVSINPDREAFQSLDDLPELSASELNHYAPSPRPKELADVLFDQVNQLRVRGEHRRQASFIVVPPHSGVSEALRRSGRRVIEPPANLLMPEQDVSSWWDEQLGDDDWVVPDLADFWLRHRFGLNLVKELFARMALDSAGKGTVCCSSWCWQFWIEYQPDIHVAPLTIAPLDSERMACWLDFLASNIGGQRVMARMTHNGRFVLPPPEEGSDRKYSDFCQDLATSARGCPGVALAIWQKALRSRAQEDSDEDAEGEEPDHASRCWVAPLDQLSLPAVPQSKGREQGFLLHGLLLHNGLALDQLELVTGVPDRDARITLARLLRADVVESGDDGIYRVTPLGYPGVRKYLQAAGYPVDCF